MSDLIDRQAAIDALWKALYEYEDKTEKQFQESEDLDVGDWIAHRGFVQNMSGIDRQTILNLPSAQPERKKGKWNERKVFDTKGSDIEEMQSAKCSVCGKYHTTPYLYFFDNFNFCPNCGADMRGDTDEQTD